MATSSIGDFFVSLGLKTDKDAFDKGVKSIDNISNSLDRLVSGVKNAAPVIAAALAGSFETAELKTAQAIGISTEALDSWKVAAGMAGTNADALTSSMANLESKMQGLKLGQVDQGLATNLAYLGIGYQQFADMDATQRMSSVFSAAQAMKDQGKAALLVSNILGSAGQDYYQYLQLSGKSLSSQLETGRRLTFTTEESKRKAMEFNSELNAVIGAGKSIGMLFGSEVGAALTPTIRSVREWLGVNREAVASGITGMISTLGDLFNRFVGFLGKGYPMARDMVDKLGGLDKIIIRLGIGFAGLKLTSIVASLGSAVSLLGPLGALVASLTLGTLAGTILDENAWDNLKTVKTDAIDPLKKAMGELIKTLTNSESVEMGINKMSNALKQFASDAVYGVTGSIEALIDIIVALTKLMKGDFTGAKEAWEASGQVFTRNEGRVGRAIFGDLLYESIFTQGKAKKLIDDITLVDQEMDLYTKEVQNYLTARGIGNKNNANFRKDPIGYRDKLLDQYQRDHPGASIYADSRVKDGIIAPGGHVTQVDPHDWVFAVKDVASLASAFIPRSYSVSSPSEYSIVQNFTFNGDTKSLPQTVRQMAFKGTQDGLAEVMSRSSQRLQLMPTTI